MQDSKKILITGGGSGGHLNAALAVIEKLKQKEPETYERIVYVGGVLGMIGDSTPSLESRKIPELGIRFIPIRSGKLHRRLSFVTFKLMWGVIGGFFDALKVVKEEKPDIIFSTGGYVTVPLVIAGWLAKIPVVIHEQTIVSGLANRIAARFAAKVLVSFPSSIAEFPAKKTILTGNPLQSNRFLSDLPVNLDSNYKQHLVEFAGSSKPFIFITGGGLGSHKLNNWLRLNLKLLIQNYNILIQTGENQYHKDFEKLQEVYQNLSATERASFWVTKWFGAEIGYIYKHADLVICRPGANTVLELLATNNKAILMPIPWSSNNEQLKNAEYFLTQQSGAIIQEANLEEQMLNKIPEILSIEKKDSAAAVNKNAAETILKIILS